MAKRSNSLLKIIGIGLLVLGVGLAYWGYDISQSVGSQISQKITGTHTDKEMTLFISGAVSAVIGFFLILRK